ncbi:MAG: LamG-like jellyroll fold domain-containing protein [Patescibacteria group bacterium]
MTSRHKIEPHMNKRRSEICGLIRGFQTRGFTIIELLVVISILGLISSIALANLESAKSKAKEAAGKQFHATLQRTLGVDTIARWEFDETTGDMAYDSSGNNLSGTITGATRTLDGISGSALSFDGGDYISGNGFSNSNGNGNATVAVWINPTDPVGSNTIFHVGDASCTVLEAGITGGRVYATHDTVGVPTLSNRVVSNNIWQNLTIVFSNYSTYDVYINGAKVDSVTNPGLNNGCPSVSWSIGARTDHTSGFNGLMDSLQVYGVSLTATEVWKVYAQGIRNMASSTTLVSI